MLRGPTSFLTNDKRARLQAGRYTHRRRGGGSQQQQQNSIKKKRAGSIHRDSRAQRRHQQSTLPRKREASATASAAQKSEAGHSSRCGYLCSQSYGIFLPSPAPNSAPFASRRWLPVRRYTGVGTRQAATRDRQVEQLSRPHNARGVKNEVASKSRTSVTACSNKNEE